MASSARKSTNKETKPTGTKKNLNDPALGSSKFLSLVKGVSFDASGTQVTHLDLAERDWRLGRTTWNKYILPVQDFSMILFKELFKTYPDYESFFIPLIDSKHHKDIYNSPKFKIHMTTRVSNKLKDIIESLDKPEELKDIMTKLGLYHFKMGVTGRHIDNMKRVIINSVRVVMAQQNKQMQSDEEESLNKCFSYAFHIANSAGEEFLESQKQIAAAQHPAKNVGPSKNP